MKSGILVTILAVLTTSLAACVTIDPNSEASAVKRLVAAEGPLQTNVDPDFEGEAYDQDGEKVECRKSKVTGSRIKQYTICRTEAEWAATEDGAKDEMGRMQDSGSGFAEETGIPF